MKKIISTAFVALLATASVGFAQGEAGAGAAAGGAGAGGGLAGAGVGAGLGVGVAVGVPLAGMALGIAAVESSQNDDSQPTSSTTTN